MRRKSYVNLAKKLKSPLAQVANGETANVNEKKPLDLHSSKDEGMRELPKVVRRLQKMSLDELELLSTSKDCFVIDCVLDQVPLIRKLQHQRDELKKQVTNLANFNYAREPEFVRDRLKLRNVLDAVDSLVKRITAKQAHPIIEKLQQIQNSLAVEARKYEEESEETAREFLEGRKSYDEFVESYLDLRKATSRKRIIADRLAKEVNKLRENLPKVAEPEIPIPAPRERKKVNLSK